MPTTLRYAFRYPAATDAPDAPGALYNLAGDIETKLAQVEDLQRVLTGIISGTAPGIVANLYNGAGAEIEVSLQAPNYYYRYLLWVSHSPFNASSGQVTVLASHPLDNTAAYGPVTQWTISSANLFAVIGGAGSNNINFSSRNKRTGF